MTVVPLKKDQVIGSFLGTATSTDTVRYSSVQVGRNSHIELNSDLVYINHSCAPNVKFDVQQRRVLALHDLSIGTELNFFYPSTEWEMQQPFECWCGSDKCLKRIQGAKFLTAD